MVLKILIHVRTHTNEESLGCFFKTFIIQVEKSFLFSGVKLLSFFTATGYFIRTKLIRLVHRSPKRLLVEFLFLGGSTRELSPLR